MKMLNNANSATVKSLTGTVMEDAKKTMASFGVTKNDIISLVSGLVTGVTVTKATGKKSLGVAAGVTVTFVMSDGLDNFKQRDRIIAEVEAAGGHVTYSDASILNGFEVRYTDADGRECVQRSC